MNSENDFNKFGSKFKFNAFQNWLKKTFKVPQTNK